MLSAVVNETHDDWDTKLAQVVFNYNNTVHDTTGYAPNKVVFRRLLSSPNDRQLSLEEPFKQMVKAHKCATRSENALTKHNSSKVKCTTNTLTQNLCF
jgi:hypothetical protein